jgi:hypothetical protein
MLLMAKPRKPAPKPTKRLLLRRLYRRGRLYVPVLALVLLAMAVALPISPPWLAGYLGRTLEQRTGLPISIDSVRLRVITGEVNLRGITLHHPDSNTPFVVQEVFLTGEPAELVAGNGRWPAHILIDSPSELTIRQRGDRVEPSGPLATLIDALSNRRPVEPKPDKDPEPSADEADTATIPAPQTAPHERPTPAVTIRNVQVALDSDQQLIDRTRLSIQRLDIPQRLAAAEPFSVNFNGIATAGLSEEFIGTLIYSPAIQRVSLRTHLAGIKRDVRVSGFGDVHLAAEGLNLTLTAQENNPGDWQVSFDQEFDRFEISEMRTGGERWIEEDLTLRARGLWQSQRGRISEASLSIGGGEIDLALTGGVLLDSELNGEARLTLRRFPAPLISIGQRLARDEGFTVSRRNDSRLLVDVAVEGPFARLGDINIDGDVQVAGWSFQRTGWPEAILVQQARGNITNSTLELSDIRLSSGTLNASGRVRFPVTVPENESRPGSLDLSLRGTPETAFDFLRALDITPAVITAATVPLTINLRSSFVVERIGGLLEPMVDTESLLVEGDVSWGEGIVLLDLIPGTIHVDAGSLVYNNAGVNVESLSLRHENVGVSAAGSLNLAAPGILDHPAYSATISTNGPIREIIDLVGSQIPLPPELESVAGNIQVDGNVSGTVARGQWPRYDLRTRINNGEGIITFQINPVQFRELETELHITNERVDVLHLATRAHDDTQATISATIDRDALRASFDATTSLETINHIVPREVRDMIMAGAAHAEGHVSLEAQKPLPEVPDVVLAWITALGDRANYRIHVIDEAALRLRIAAEIETLEPATLYHRSFPHPVDNIRGRVRADELGFIMEGIPGRWGDAEDVVVSGRVTLGHVGPVNITFEAVANELDINDWMHDWGKREWAETPEHLRPRRAQPAPTIAGQPPAPPGGTPRLQTTIKGHLRLGRTQFLSVRGQDVVGNFDYEVWRNGDNRLRISVDEATIYGGSIKSTSVLLFPEEGLPLIRSQLEATDVGINGFLADLRQDEEQTVGLFTGKATLDGAIGDYSTWVGSGEYFIRESKFIGDQVLIVLSRALRLGFEQTQANTTWQGTGTYRNEVVSLPDVQINNAEFKLLANGTVGFNGDLDFRISVEFLGNRIEWIPLVRHFAPYVNRLTDFFVSARLEGTVYEPAVRMVPLQMDVWGPTGGQAGAP